MLCVLCVCCVRGDPVLNMLTSNKFHLWRKRSQEKKEVMSPKECLWALSHISLAFRGSFTSTGLPWSPPLGPRVWQWVGVNASPFKELFLPNTECETEDGELWLRFCALCRSPSGVFPVASESFCSHHFPTLTQVNVCYEVNGERKRRTSHG